MTRIRSLIALVFVASLTIACGTQAESASTNTSTLETSSNESNSAPDATPKPSDDSNDACAHLDPEALRTALSLDTATEINEADVMNAHRYNDRSRSCTWTWDRGRISLQITTEPENNRFDTWASRMVARHLEEGKGGESVDGLGDSAAFIAKESGLVWRDGEETLYNLSFGGNAPSERMDLDSLRAIAETIN